MEYNNLGKDNQEQVQLPTAQIQKQIWQDSDPSEAKPSIVAIIESNKSEIVVGQEEGENSPSMAEREEVKKSTLFCILLNVTLCSLNQDIVKIMFEFIFLG